MARRLVVAALVLAAVAAAPTGTGASAQPEAAAPEAAEAALAGITQFDVGTSHSCARLDTGQARCWGHNLFRQLGAGGVPASGQPVAVLNGTGTGPMTGVAAVFLGAFHTCARLGGGQARCWGTNGNGELGTGDAAPHTFAVPVAGVGATTRLTGVRQLALGFDHTCAIVTGGQVRCWGDNGEHQLGDGTDTERTRPVVVLDTDGVGPLTGATQITAGQRFTCARLATGRAVCWGDNAAHQLGDNTNTDRDQPTLVSNPGGSGPLQNVASVSAGKFFACARLANGQARCWGTGPLGNGSFSERPVSVLASGNTPLTGVAQLSAGDDHVCARTTAGRARCWGDNDNFQLGDRSNSDRSRPVPLVNALGTGPIAGVKGVAAGGDHTCLRIANGRAACVGNNDSGQLGAGAGADQDRPIGVLA